MEVKEGGRERRNEGWRENGSEEGGWKKLYKVMMVRKVKSLNAQLVICIHL